VTTEVGDISVEDSLSSASTDIPEEEDISVEDSLSSTSSDITEEEDVGVEDSLSSGSDDNTEEDYLPRAAAQIEVPHPPASRIPFPLSQEIFHTQQAPTQDIPSPRQQPPNDATHPVQEVSGHPR
jgi:hypothetical protein